MFCHYFHRYPWVCTTKDNANAKKDRQKQKYPEIKKKEEDGQKDSERKREIELKDVDEIQDRIDWVEIW